MAEEARAQLVLPEPAVGGAPPLGGEGYQVVQFPTWLWIDRDQWEPRTARAEVGGGSVEVTASPDEVVWDMGDGNTVRCSGPGTAFRQGVHEPGSRSPDCGHVYTSSSKNRAGRDRVEARLVWQVEWSATNGQGGAMEPMETSASRTVEVVEVHSLVTEG
ncbi:hypothetical protein [Nocardiopsis chromatogenes]|uniref:hypothetical protein n=1 Tax=Nocardiopsis chromatogenes TaxID=280239 RepID=UPI001EF9E126|nr:hypothetical protein [Nocardiopsis chromatogenes]